MKFDNICLNMFQMRQIRHFPHFHYQVGDVDPKQRRLNIIGQRHQIVEQNIPITNTTIPDITDIPDGINLISGLNTNHNDTNEKKDQSSSSSTANKNRMNCAMIIDILTDSIMNSLPNSKIMQDTISLDTYDKIKDLSFQAIIAKYTLDFKRSFAFEIMATSFILK